MPQDFAAKDTKVKVYLDYTAEELDWQYDHSKRFPDTSLFNKARGEKSRLVREKIKGQLNVPYGSGETDLLDIYPAAQKDAPIGVFIHGGAWTRGSKNDYSFPAASFVPRGVTWVVPDFSNIPPGTLDSMAKQNRDAVAWVYRNAKSFGGDPDRIHVLGHSSGGHLSAMVQCTDWQKLYGLPGDLVKGGVCMSGIYDLQPIYLSYRNKYLGLDDAAWRRNSPIHNVRTDYMPPLIIGCGEYDTAEFHRQPLAYADAIRKKGYKAEWIELPGRHHFAVSDAFNEDGPLQQLIFRQMGV